jgi:hypothetical protein
MTELEPSPRSELSEADFRGCRWIENEPSPIRSGLWCCKTTVPGSSYCQAHRDRAWTASRRRSPTLRKSGVRLPPKPLK